MRQSVQQRLRSVLCTAPLYATPSLSRTARAVHTSPHTLSCARRWRRCAPSPCVLSRPYTTSPAGQEKDASTTSTLGFDDFVARVQQLLQEGETTEDKREGLSKPLPDAAAQQAAMATLWETSYHQHVFAALRRAGPPTTATGRTAGTPEWEGCIPHDVETLPLFLVCITAAANMLSKAASAEGEGEGNERCRVYVEEMRALALFVIYNYVPSMSSLFDWKEEAASLEGKGLSTSPVADTNPAAVTSTHVVPVSTADKAYREAIEELRLERRGREKVHELAPRLSADVLLRMTVLLDMVHSVLTTFALPLKGYAVLYQALLCGLSTSAQLRNATLLVLLDCLQRCMDGYLAELDLSAEASNPSLAAEEEGDRAERLDSYDDVRCFLPAWYWQEGAHPNGALSLVEAEEQSRLAQRRGGLQRTAVLPTVVLDHLHIVARVLCQRMETQILDYQRAHLQADGMNSAASKRWKDDAAREAMALRQLQSEKGKLNLMRLEERKKKEVQNGPQAGPPRRTLRAIQAAAAKTETEEKGVEASITEKEKEEEEELQQLVPAQLALCCTYLAAMRFHDEAYWTTVRRLSCLLLHCRRESLGSTTAEGKAAGVEYEAEEETLMLAMKDITFAFDYVHRPGDYERVMETLVKERYLPKPIPPPSQYRRAMASVPGQNV